MTSNRSSSSKPGRTRRSRSSPKSNTTSSTRSASIPSVRKGVKSPRTPDEHAAPSRPGGSNADDDSTIQQPTMADTPTSAMPPTHLFLRGAANDQTIGDEVTVSALVAKRIFPHVKFVRNPVDELAFTNDAKSICGIVRTYCNPPENIPATDWWQNARRWVGRQIAIQRSSKNTRLKWTFMGTYTILLSLLITVTNFFVSSVVK